MLIVLAAGLAAPAAAQERELALAVAREVERLVAARTLWPGFEPLAIPLAVFTGEHTWLFRHPAPPEGFAPAPGAEPPAYVYQGRHPAATSNSSADIGGTVTATLLADGPRAARGATALAATALHEAFHVYQRRRHPGWSGNEGNVFLYPTADAALLALRRLETAALAAALRAADSAGAACGGREALRYRRERFAAMDTAFSAYERLTELNEGLATYVQLLAAGERTIAIPDAEFPPGAFRERIYTVGPALAFLLDRVRPGWQVELEAGRARFLDQLLAGAVGAGGEPEPCALPPDPVAAVERAARADAAGVLAARGARRRAFDARPGWRVVVEAAPGHPLWPQGFDPLNVEQVEGGFLHTRFLRLGNDAGELRVIDEAGADLEALTEGVGPHPLFNGVARLAVAGLARPEVTIEGARVSLRAAGLTLRLGGARAEVQDTEVRIRLEPPADSAAARRPGAEPAAGGEPGPAELEEITVSSTRTERRIEDEVLRVEVLGREEVEEKLLMTPGDITMMLNETGGLRVQTTAPSLGGASVRVQGLRGRYTAVLADGLPLYGGQVGGLGLLQIPPMDLGRVEVIKGAASALYGGSALGGVVNLLSRRPDGAREALLNATSFGGTDAVAWLASPGEEPVGYTLLAGAHRQGRVDRDGDGWTDVAGYRRVVLRPRVFARDAAGRSLLVTGGFTGEERDGGTLAGGTVPGGGPYAEGLSTTRGDLGAIGRALLGGAWLLTARTSAALLSHRHRFGGARERDSHLTWFAEGAVHRDFGGVVAVLGAGVQGDRYRNRDLPGFDYAYAAPGGFAQGEWSPASALTLALSARVDHHSRYGTFATPRLSALLRLGGFWSLRASAGTGYFAPTPFTEETEATGLGPVDPPSGLEAERARGASLDLGGTLGSVEVNATVFASRIDHAVRLVPAPNGRVRLANAPDATRTRGLDLLARLHREPWHLTATYTHVRATEPDPAGAGRRTVPLTPRHSAGAVGTWEREGATRIGVELYYTGRQALDANPYRTRSRSYLVVGALGEHRVGRFRLFLNLENLTDARQTRFDPLLLPARAPDGRWTTDAWAPLEGRVVNGGMRLEW